MKSLVLACVAGVAVAAVAEQTTNIAGVREASRATAEITVDPAAEVGPIKPMNGSNNAPIKPRTDQRRTCWREFLALKTPFVRTHDAGGTQRYGGQHVADITAMFPNFDADETDPKSYDFALTDWLLGQWRESGAEIFFRLGQTIEHWPKKYGTVPPKDFDKWARICEHVIRHYNEGWADGHKWNIRYWEIWNEPDLADSDPPNFATWGGTREQFFDLFVKAAKHLKAAFPALKIGGPAVCYNKNWARAFVDRCRRDEVPLDFFSWHGYTGDVGYPISMARFYRKLLDDAGYVKAESIYNEWNYNQDWNVGFQKSVQDRQGLKGGAFVFAVMSVCQDAPVDMLMYYDFRPNVPEWNGVFDDLTYVPRPAYWSLYAWRRLVESGTQVKCATQGETDGVYVTAAKSAEGRCRIAVGRYTRDDNDFSVRTVSVRVKGKAFASGLARAVNSRFSFGDVELPVRDGALELELEPNSLFFIEL